MELEFGLTTPVGPGSTDQSRILRDSARCILQPQAIMGGSGRHPTRPEASGRCLRLQYASGTAQSLLEPPGVARSCQTRRTWARASRRGLEPLDAIRPSPRPPDTLVAA
jgi:hypothetical protein